jgi:glutaminase
MSSNPGPGHGLRLQRGSRWFTLCGMENLNALLQQAHALGRAETGGGAVADYIPELLKADPSLFGIAIATVDGDTYHAGDADVPFTLQSVSKVFSLALLLRKRGDGAFDDMSCEPSGDAFHSIVRLEEEHGRPRNPYINAGAIKVTGSLPGAEPKAKIDGLREFLQGSCPDWDFAVDEAVCLSESRTGYRNRALAHFMAHHGQLQDPRTAVEAYFRQCGIQVTAQALARVGLFLANRGRSVRGEREIIPLEANRTVVAMMALCGLYDEVGHFAMTTGIPAKSGVSGGILAIAPGRMSIAAYGPALGPKGNSVAGLRALLYLAQELDLSIYH